MTAVVGSFFGRRSVVGGDVHHADEIFFSFFLFLFSNYNLHYSTSCTTTDDGDDDDSYISVLLLQ